MPLENRVRKSSDMLTGAFSPPSGCCCRPSRAFRSTAQPLLQMTLFPSKKKIPFCKNADTMQLVVPSAEQTTDKRALPPRRNPLPVQTVGTFAGPRQELQRYQGREEEEEQDGKKEKTLLQQHRLGLFQSYQCCCGNRPAH